MCQELLRHDLRFRGQPSVAKISVPNLGSQPFHDMADSGPGAGLAHHWKYCSKQGDLKWRPASQVPAIQASIDFCASIPVRDIERIDRCINLVARRISNERPSRGFERVPGFLGLEIVRIERKAVSQGVPACPADVADRVDRLGDVNQRFFGKC